MPLNEHFATFRGIAVPHADHGFQIMITQREKHAMPFAER